MLEEQQGRIAAEQKIKEQQLKDQEAANDQEPTQGLSEGSENQGDPATTAKPIPAPAPLVKPKTVTEVSISKVYDSVLTEAYIETPEQTEQFINELKQQLNAAIQKGSKVRIK